MPDHHHLERLAAQPQQVQIQPVITELAGCVPVVEDVTVGNGMQCKQLTLIHQSGVIGWRIPLPLPMAKDIGTKLCAPRGVEIPSNGQAQ
jgi:hypothetical protein